MKTTSARRRKVRRHWLTPFQILFRSPFPDRFGAQVICVTTFLSYLYLTLHNYPSFKPIYGLSWIDAPIEILFLLHICVGLRLCMEIIDVLPIVKSAIMDCFAFFLSLARIIVLPMEYFTLSLLEEVFRVYNYLEGKAKAICSTLSVHNIDFMEIFWRLPRKTISEHGLLFLELFATWYILQNASKYCCLVFGILASNWMKLFWLFIPRMKLLGVRWYGNSEVPFSLWGFFMFVLIFLTLVSRLLSITFELISQTVPAASIKDNAITSSDLKQTMLSTPDFDSVISTIIVILLMHLMRPLIGNEWQFKLFTLIPFATLDYPTRKPQASSPMKTFSHKVKIFAPQQAQEQSKLRDDWPLKSRILFWRKKLAPMKDGIFYLSTKLGLVTLKYLQTTNNNLYRKLLFLRTRRAIPKTRPENSRIGHREYTLMHRSIQDSPWIISVFVKVPPSSLSYRAQCILDTGNYQGNIVSEEFVLNVLKCVEIDFLELTQEEKKGGISASGDSIRPLGAVHLDWYFDKGPQVFRNMRFLVLSNSFCDLIIGARSIHEYNMLFSPNLGIVVPNDKDRNETSTQGITDQTITPLQTTDTIDTFRLKPLVEFPTATAQVGSVKTFQEMSKPCPDSGFVEEIALCDLIPQESYTIVNPQVAITTKNPELSRKETISLRTENAPLKDDFLLVTHNQQAQHESSPSRNSEATLSNRVESVQTPDSMTEVPQLPVTPFSDIESLEKSRFTPDTCSESSENTIDINSKGEGHSTSSPEWKPSVGHCSRITEQEDSHLPMQDSSSNVQTKNNLEIKSIEAFDSSAQSKSIALAITEITNQLVSYAIYHIQGSLESSFIQCPSDGSSSSSNTSVRANDHDSGDKKGKGKQDNNKRRKTREDGAYDRGEDENSEREDEEGRKGSGNHGNDYDHGQWGCIFYNLHPGRYPTLTHKKFKRCSSGSFRRLDELLTHIRDVHGHPELFCPRCDVVFPESKLFKHLESSKYGSRCSTSVVRLGIDEEMREKLDSLMMRKKPRSQPFQQRWDQVFEIVFPGAKVKPSVYFLEGAKSVEKFKSFLQKNYASLVKEHVIQALAKSRLDDQIIDLVRSTCWKYLEPLGTDVIQEAYARYREQEAQKSSELEIPAPSSNNSPFQPRSEVNVAESRKQAVPTESQSYLLEPPFQYGTELFFHKANQDSDTVSSSSNATNQCNFENPPNIVVADSIDQINSSRQPTPYHSIHHSNLIRNSVGGEVLGPNNSINFPTGLSNVEGQSSSHAMNNRDEFTTKPSFNLQPEISMAPQQSKAMDSQVTASELEKPTDWQDVDFDNFDWSPFDVPEVLDTSSTSSAHLDVDKLFAGIS